MANSHLATKMKLGSMQSKQAAQAVKKALEEDPTVFQYDEVYDDMERDRVEKKEQAKGDRKPKYMHELMKAAERRKRENERRIEVQVQRDLEKEGDMYKDKEAFVTGAYKKKMEELKRIEEEEKRQDAMDELTDVSKQKDLSGFYRHLYRTTMSEDKPKCEVKKTAADSSSDVPSSEEKKSRRHAEEEETSSKRVERRDSSPPEAEDRRKSHSSSHKDSDAKDYHRERSDKDRSSHRHHHHHHHRDRSRSRERDREKDRRRDREVDRHRDRDYERKEKDRDRRDRDRDRDDRGAKHRDRDRDRDHDRRRERDRDHRYHPYSRRDSDKKRRSRTRSRSPAAHARRQSSSHQSSTPSKFNQNSGTKENRLPSSASKAKDSASQAQRTLKHINEHPIWKKRTVGDAFKEALERYIERKRSGVIAAEISREK